MPPLYSWGNNLVIFFWSNWTILFYATQLVHAYTHQLCAMIKSSAVGHRTGFPIEENLDFRVDVGIKTTVRDKNLHGVFSMNKISTRFQMSSSLYRISEWFWNFFASWGLAFSDWLSKCSWQSRRTERYWRDIRTRGWVVMPNKNKSLIQWGSEYRTSLVFRWSKVVWFPNGLVLECYVTITTILQIT